MVSSHLIIVRFLNNVSLYFHFFACVRREKEKMEKKQIQFSDYWGCNEIYIEDPLGELNNFLSYDIRHTTSSTTALFDTIIFMPYFQHFVIAVTFEGFLL